MSVCKWDVMRMDDRLDSLRGWAKQGATDADLLRIINGGRGPDEGTDDDPTISYRTFYEWKKKRKKFADAISAGKDIANGELLCAAFNRSTGYYITDHVTVKCKKQRVDELTGKTLTDEVLETVAVQKFIEPDPRMIMYMIGNRMPREYKAKRDEQPDATVVISFDPLPGKKKAATKTQPPGDAEDKA